MQRKIIAVITARADDSEQKTMLHGIAEAAFSMNADVAVFSNVYNHWISDELLNFEDHIYDFFQPESFDGVIVNAEPFMDLSVLNDVFSRIRSSGIPAVMISGEEEGFQTVSFDDEADMEQIAEHLIKVHGLTQIDILTGPAGITESEARVAGCKRAFEKHGIPFDEDHVYNGDFWNDSGAKLAERYLSGELSMPQAVICTNDYMAFGLCDTLTAAGIPIPERITITGYDHSGGRIYHNPILTTYYRDRRNISAKAAELILGSGFAHQAEENRFVRGNTCSCGLDNSQLNEELRLARIGQFHSAMNTAAQFTSRLTLCRTLAEYTAVLKEFYYLLHGADALYLCLDSAWNSTETENEEFLCCEVRENCATDAPKRFSRDALPPALSEQRDAPMMFYFSPLCFQKRLFGYTVLAYNSPDRYDLSFRDWNKTVSNTLEILRMKNDIHYLKQCQRTSSLYDSLTGFYHLSEFRKIVETTGSEISGGGSLQAVKLNFPTDAEYLYGENYRSDIVSEAARIIKLSLGKHEICCRGADDVFLVLCKSEDSGVFSEKLRVMMYNELCTKYGEDQVTVTYLEHNGKPDGKAVDEMFHDLQCISDEETRMLMQRRGLPHYRTLLEIREQIQKSPKKTPSTEEICRSLCISDGYFRVTYKKCFGVSYVQDCINARIMLAKYLLCTTAMSIYAIALKCGYNDEKYFDRQFRQSVGASPMQYRTQYC